MVVTHETGFAREMADRFAFMDDGRWWSWARPTACWWTPGEWTRTFLSQGL